MATNRQLSVVANASEYGMSPTKLESSFSKLKKSNTRLGESSLHGPAKSPPVQRVAVSVETASLLSNRLRMLATKGREKSQLKMVKAKAPPRKNVFNTDPASGTLEDLDTPIHMEGLETTPTQQFLEKFGKKHSKPR